MVKSKLPPQSGYSLELEAVEKFMKKGHKVFFP